MQTEFKDYWDKIPISARTYLEQVGLERWTQVFQCGIRYNSMTTYIVECVNSILKDARELSIAALLDHIREWLQAKYYKHRTRAANCEASISKYGEQVVTQAEENAIRHVVRPVDRYEFQVEDEHLGGRVNIHTRMCTCREFDCFKLPCSHAIAACIYRKVPCLDLCSPCLRRSNTSTRACVKVENMGRFCRL